MAEQKEVAVATFSFETDALMWAEALKQEGIPSVLVPLGPGAGAFGSSVWRPFELRVREADLGRAREVLSPYLEEVEEQTGDQPSKDEE